MIKIIENSFDQSVYNQSAHHPLQSWQWGEARRQMGIEVLRIGQFVETIHELSLHSTFQITFHKIPHTNLKIGYLPRSVLPTKEVLQFLYDYAKKNAVIFIKIEPYVLKSETSNAKWEVNSKYKLQISKHPLFPQWTQILNLDESEDELLQKMHSKTRYNVRLAQKKGVVVREMSTNEGFKIFSRLYFETCKRQKYFGHTLRYHQIIWEHLRKDMAHILIAYYNNIPLAAYELFRFQKKLYYPYGGSSLEYRNTMAANLLMWEAIKFGKHLGAQQFDMWGSLPPQYDPNDSWAGFTRFKEGYGGKFTEMVGSFDLIVRPGMYNLYAAADFVRSVFLKLNLSI